MMKDGLVICDVNESNQTATQVLVAEYGNYLFGELKLMAGSESFLKELEKFPDYKYKKPDGAFYLVSLGDTPIGCLGFKRWSETECELKRMYIKEEYRGRGFAAQLIAFILKEAAKAGYRRMLLDTNVEMAAAHKAYLNAGFKIIPPYCENENSNPVFLAYELASAK